MNTSGKTGTFSCLFHGHKIQTELEQISLPFHILQLKWNSHHFIYLKSEKGTPFGRSLLVLALIRSPPWWFARIGCLNAPTQCSSCSASIKHEQKQTVNSTDLRIYNWYKPGKESARKYIVWITTTTCSLLIEMLISLALYRWYFSFNKRRSISSPVDLSCCSRSFIVCDGVTDTGDL